MATAKQKQAAHPQNKWIVVRRSKVHGNGCFARRFIPKGTRIIEYLGERISHKEADRRYEGSDVNDNHTFLSSPIARRSSMRPGAATSRAGSITTCDGNCESETEKGRVFVDAIKDIEKGEELGYDYQIGRDKKRSAECRRDLRLPLRLAQVPRHDVVAGQTTQARQAQEGQEAAGSGKRQARYRQHCGQTQQGQVRQGAIAARSKGKRSKAKRRA